MKRVRAAGGVVVQFRPDGSREVLLVHRPRYGDWTLPKGKAHLNESDEDCALREVWEETGLRCRLGAELASSVYLDRRGRQKVVRYWEMSPSAGVAEGQNEVDEVVWLPISEAMTRLTHERDKNVLSSL
jgi:8-oxo-dGTP diphosphatase